MNLGFNNVIDAFHVVAGGDVPERFSTDERIERKGILITDNLLKLKEHFQFSNFSHEVEARWRLVETAWSLKISPQLLEVRHDLGDNILFTETDLSRRINITSSRDSLNGYQKGKCFYCRKGIRIEKSNDGDIVDVDHFFPHTLLNELPEFNINGVWNLVLACQECNRGTGGKFERIPKIQFLERLHARNEYLINSHHPLRETIINQTGKDTPKRIKFLQQMDQKAIDIIPTRWSPLEAHEG